ncbi:ATP-binding cassette domain-containing protein [Brevibacterium marinum]|uniref:ABC-type glutathione transport system ATPase component n=1 Tax=Brevibacterium marinum TaxID=418643 RepID=A0A846RMK1_9MICO|nr:ABC-type glutathione transport system ATPase component [Brevibacterium marinum]
MNTIAVSRCCLQLPAGDRILSDLSVELPMGRITWLVGESGAGKSTLCNLLAGLTPARAQVTGHLDMGGGSGEPGTRGRAEECGTLGRADDCGTRGRADDCGTRGRADDCGTAGSVDLGTRRGRKLLAGMRRRGELAWAPQNAMDTFPPRLRLREWFHRAGIESPDLVPFGLENTMLERHPHELSGGQISRVSLAAALAHSPRLLVCDEPTAGLDPGQADSMVTVLDDCVRGGGAAVLAVTHDLSSMARNARPDDQVAVIFNGHIVDACSVEVFLSTRADNAYSRALAAAAPVTGAHPLPLAPDHLGGRGYREGDELRRLHEFEQLPDDLTGACPGDRSGTFPHVDRTVVRETIECDRVEWTSGDAG